MVNETENNPVVLSGYDGLTESVVFTNIYDVGIGRREPEHRAAP